MTLSPKQKLTHTRTRKRYMAWVRLNAIRLKNLVSLQYDKEGTAVALSHFASPLTGEYKGKKVVTVSQTGSKNKVKKIRA